MNSEESIMWEALSGGGGIRTPGTLSSAAVLQTAAFNHSATPGQKPQEASLQKSWEPFPPLGSVVVCER